MKPSAALELHGEIVSQVVYEHRASSPRVFGSVLHHEDTDDGDLGLLVDPPPDAFLRDIARTEVELEERLDVPVDVRTPRSLREIVRLRVLR